MRPTGSPHSKTGARIVLTMIVKDEARVIERCIDALRPLIDAWCIVDTGSSDGTQDIIRRALSDLPGALHERPWLDFAHNRSEALELARPWGEFSLMIDADVECVIDDQFDPAGFRQSLDADVFHVALLDSVHYRRPLITSTRLPFSYRGVLHEFLAVPDGAVDGGAVSGFHYRSHTDGARWRNPRKYHDDAALLRAALDADRDPDLRPRYTFYLAQSLRDAGEYDQAAEMYLERTTLGGWVEEIYVSWLWHARMLRRSGAPLAAVLDALARAHDTIPSRAEACCEAARYAREDERMPTAYLYAARAASRPSPADGLFLEPDVYEWRAMYELSIAAYYVGEIEQGRAATQAVLAASSTPEQERSAVQANLRFYEPS
jgi:tetratricopeptide (TPR) repeat protein